MLDDLREARQQFERTVAKISRPTKRLADQFQRMAETFDQMEGVLEGRPGASVPEKSGPGLHPIIRFLVWRNIEYAKTQGIATAVAQDLLDITGPVLKRPRGRPADISIATVIEAKKLRDRRWSYAKIGNQLGFSGPAIRSALRYHYPENNSG